jgi:hypothetical protein
MTVSARLANRLTTPLRRSKLRLVFVAVVALALLAAGCSSPPKKNTVGYGFGMTFQKSSKS